MAADLASEEASRLRRSEAAQAAADRARARLEDGFGTVVDALVNYSLWNVKHRVAMEAYTIDGTPQAGRRDTDPAASFRRMLGFSSKPKASGRVAGEMEPEEQTSDTLPPEPPIIAVEDAGDLVPDNDTMDDAAAGA